MDIRLSNLRSLETQLGGRSKLSELTNVDYAQYTAYIGKNPKRNIGEKLARKIEKNLIENGIPNIHIGWLDEDHKNIISSVKNITQELMPLNSICKIPYLSIESLSPSGDKTNSKESPMLYLTEIQKAKLLESCSALENLAAYEIKDATMEPLLSKGCMVLVDTANKAPLDGKRYAFRMKDEIAIRRVYVYPDKFKISCDSEDLKIKKAHRDLEITNFEGDIEIIGRTVWASIQVQLDD